MNKAKGPPGHHGQEGLVRLWDFFLGKLSLNPQELTARNFSLGESFKSGGILYVFPAFGTARIGEKSRCSAAGDLFRGSLRLHRKEGLPRMILENHFETAPFVITLHIEGFHGQNRVTDLSQIVHQRLGIFGADGFIGNHVGEVVHAVQFLGGGIDAVTHLILQQLGQPYDTAHAAFGSDELLGGDEVLAVTHEARRLHAAAGHGGHLGERHAERGHAGVLTHRDDNAHADRLDAADAFEAAAGGHRILEQGVQRDVLQRAVGILGNGFVDVLVGAEALVDALFLGDDLAGTLRVKLVGRLGVQPGNGAAQTQTLRSDDAHVARREGLAHDAGVEHGDGFVGHGGKTLVTLVENDVRSGAQSLVRLVADDDLDLALVNNGVEFGLDLRVQDFADVAEAEARLKVGLVDTDTDHVALAGVHQTLNAVQELVDLTLEDRLKVGLHGLAGDLDGVGQGDLAADGDLVHLGAFDGDLVILDLGGILGDDQLEAVLAGAVDLDLHIALADDLALKGGGVGHGNVDVRDLELDAAGFDGGVDPVLGVLVDDQALRNGPHIVGVVRDDGEAHLDGAGAAGHGDVGHGGIGVDEGVDAVEGVAVEAVPVAGLDRAEDHRRTDDE